MGIIQPSSCVCDYVEQGCQDIADTWNWGWNGENFFAARPGDTISGVVWTIPSELSQSNEVVTTEVFYTLISNNTGLAGETYSIFAEMTTSSGEVVNFRIDITLRDITAVN